MSDHVKFFDIIIGKHEDLWLGKRELEHRKPRMTEEEISYVERLIEEVEMSQELDEYLNTIPQFFRYNG